MQEGAGAAVGELCGLRALVACLEFQSLRMSARRIGYRSPLRVRGIGVAIDKPLYSHRLCGLGYSSADPCS